MAVKINRVSILRGAQNAIKSGVKDREIRAFLDEKAFIASKEIVNELRNEFDKHPVTRELASGGNTTTRVGGFPVGPRGSRYGNLAAYYGLSDTKITTDLEIIKALFSNFQVKTTRKSGGDYEIAISFPKEKDFYSVTPPPSDAYPVSWLNALENGLVQNFSHFLFRKRGFNANSRSETGVQVESELRKGAQSVPAVPYIKDIYGKILDDVGRAKRILGNAIRRKFKV